MATNSQLIVKLDLSEASGSVDVMINPDAISQCIRNILRQFETGRMPGKLSYYITDGDGDQAEHETTIVDYSEADVGDTITIGGIVLTVAATADHSKGYFAAATSNDVTGANIVACLEAQKKSKGLLTAAYAANVVTSTFDEGGVCYNSIESVSSNTDFATVDANASSGTDGTIHKQLTIDQRNKSLA